LEVSPVFSIKLWWAELRALGRTLLTRDVSRYLVDRYSERRETAEELSKRVNFKSI
jgi:hypothetical protein